jgi:hypothetical protein
MEPELSSSASGDQVCNTIRHHLKNHTTLSIAQKTTAPYKPYRFICTAFWHNKAIRDKKNLWCIIFYVVSYPGLFFF